jgi:hypothetical protein
MNQEFDSVLCFDFYYFYRYIDFNFYLFHSFFISYTALLNKTLAVWRERMNQQGSAAGMIGNEYRGNAAGNLGNMPGNNYFPSGSGYGHKEEGFDVKGTSTLDIFNNNIYIMNRMASG